jgi:hypothetical protein
VRLSLFGFGLSELGFGLLALGLTSGFWMVYLVFRFGFSKLAKRTRRWHIPLLHGISLFFVGLSSGLLGILIGLFSISRGWFAGNPFDIPFIMTACTIIFYSLLVIGNLNEEPKPSAPDRANEFRYIYVLLAILAGVGLILWFGLQEGRLAPTTTFVAIVSLIGVSLLWYALDPLSVTKPGLLREENERKSVFSWDKRVLLFITIALMFYLALSSAVYFFDYRQIGDIIFAVILHFFVSAGILAVTMGILGSKVPSYFLDAFSGLYNTDALKTKKKYDQLTRQRIQEPDPEKAKRYWYYGRVCREGDWTVLQYNYFYAFNDFRSTAGGMNNHEGDWECVNVLLQEEVHQRSCMCTGKFHIKPFGVIYSQHYHGEFRFWEDVAWAKNEKGYATCHPLVYAALGSHANYPRPEVYSLSNQFAGATQRLVARLEQAILMFRTRSRLVENHIREVERAFEILEGRQQGGIIAQGDKFEGGSREFACGDGIRVGYGFDPKLNVYEDELKVVIAPPSTVKRRESNFDGKPASSEDVFDDWAFEVIDDDLDWVKYKGMWGRKSNVEGESGPQGPRWDTKGDVRVRWEGRADAGHFLEWLDVLLLDIVQDDTKSTRFRMRALQLITFSHQHRSEDEQ